MTLHEIYYYVNTELADPRTNAMPTMSSPIYPLCIIAVYVYLVFKAIPNYMKNRKAYELKEFILAYNIYQIVACSYVTYGMLTSGWITQYTWLCQGVDTSNSPEAIRMANFCWILTSVKLSEFIETAVFALRKKQKQISFLHVYHHISTYLIVWIGTKYFPGGSYTFPTLLNSFVHVIMYTYYLLTLFKASWLQKALAKYKPYLTIIQMIQFTILLIYATQGMRSSCTIPKSMNLIFTPNVVLVFYLFYTFYRKSYTKKE